MKSLLFLLLITFPLVSMAQIPDPAQVNPFTLELFSSLTALSAGILSITLIIKRTFHTSGLITDLVSWILGPVLAVIGWIFNLGMFSDMLWYIALLYGIIAAFSANKGWDIFKLVFPSKQSVPQLKQ